MYIKPQFLQLESPLLISSNTNNSVLITKLFYFKLHVPFNSMVYLVFLHSIDTYRIQIPENSQNTIQINYLYNIYYIS